MYTIFEQLNEPNRMKPKNLAFCESCVNKSFDKRKGITCGLTNEKPNFEDHCPSFNFDKDNYRYAYNSLNENSIKAERGTRFVNYLIDYLATVILVVLLSNYLVLMAFLSPILMMIVVTLLLTVYYFIMELVSQKTLGKMVTKTIVVDEKTFGKPSQKQILIRSLFRLPIINFIDAVSFLMYGNLHDKASNTIVVSSNPTKLEKAKILIDLKKENKE